MHIVYFIFYPYLSTFFFLVVLSQEFPMAQLICPVRLNLKSTNLKKHLNATEDNIALLLCDLPNNDPT